MKNTIYLAMSMMVCLALVGTPAQAKDAVRVTIDDAGGGFVLTQSGAFQTPGTYAVGTMKVHFNVIAFDFLNAVRTFDMCLDVVQGKAKPATAYPATVALRQVGTPNVSVNLTPQQVTFEHAAEEHCVTVSVSVPADLAADPDFQVDGTELVANVQLSTGPRVHLDTVTTVKVHLTLVHPSETACVVPLHFVSDLALSGNLSSTGVAAQHNVGNGKTTWTPNEGQHVVGLVNTCTDTVTLDLATSVSSSWALHSQQAVRSTVSNQEFVDIGDLLAVNHDLSTFATHGLAQCLKGIEIPGLASFILAQHLKVKDDAAIPGSYGAPSTPWAHTGFQYGAYDSNPAFDCASLDLSLDVDANEGNASIPITQVSYNGSGAPDPEYPPAD